MLGLFAHRSYRRLFAAQVLSLLGSGLTTIALALLAYELAGAGAGAALGIVLFIKMVAYVGLSPFAGALAHSVPRRRFMVSLDLVRAGFVLLLPFVTALWQVYLLVFLFQSASALFTPTYQATIADLFETSEDYDRALSLSRLAYDLESLASPLLAGLLLGVISFGWLFVGTTLGFLASAALIVGATVPRVPGPEAPAPFRKRLTWGMTIYLRTPRLRGLLALVMASAAGSAYVIVNSVVLVNERLGAADSGLAWAMGAFGAGSIVVALALPSLLKQAPERRLMALGASLQLGALAIVAGVITTDALTWPNLLAMWFLAGAGNSAVLTPAGRLLRNSSAEPDRPALFAAHFALSHACWLIAYPAAGLLGVTLGFGPSLAVLAGLGVLSLVTALWLWPAADPAVVAHDHRDLTPDNPHLNHAHPHRFVIDADHPHWPVDARR